jgi:hypothetical protein
VVAIAAIQVIAAHPMLGREVADDRFNGGATLHSGWIGVVTRRTLPVIQTRNFSLWLWPRLPLSPCAAGLDASDEVGRAVGPDMTTFVQTMIGFSRRPVRDHY